MCADEIFLFRTLVAIRRCGRPGPKSILNAPETLIGAEPCADYLSRLTYSISQLPIAPNYLGISGVGLTRGCGGLRGPGVGVTPVGGGHRRPGVGVTPVGPPPRPQFLSASSLEP